MKALIAALALAVLATTASADTVWNYQGNVIDYFTGIVPGPSDISPFALTGSVTLNDQNVAVAWSFNDGVSTLTNFNSTGKIFDDLLPGPGIPLFFTWGVDLTGNNGDHIRSSFFGSLNEAVDVGGLVNVRSDPGTWTEVVGTPEPGTLASLGVGLVGLLARKYSRISTKSV